MRRLHFFLVGFGVVYSAVIIVVMTGIKNLNWDKDHSLYIALMVGILISLNAVKSLLKQRQQLSK